MSSPLSILAIVDHLTDVTVLLVYLVILTTVCIYGVHRYWMVWQFIRGRARRRRTGADQPAGRFEYLPHVTVQIPMFNERRVGERIIEAACNLDYPRERLQVQVLDDSTDVCANIARQCCERLRAAGHNVQYIHRTNRDGYKAGALANGLHTATGAYIAIFDADFVPPRDLIQRTIHHFSDEAIGMVQTRWSHLNRDQSLLTELQSMYLDGHFVIEQGARADNGHWFNFNGTAGIWRRACIDDAGGWAHDTLTEDTDLSYRAQLNGWQFKYLPDVCCPAEVPPTVSAFLSQQHRWNKGLMQCAIKLLPTILRRPIPLRRKIEAWFHLTGPLIHVVILALALLIAPMMFATTPVSLMNPAIASLLGVSFFVLGAVAAATFYLASQRAQGLGMFRTVLRLPALMALGVGISVVNTKAVIEAVLGRQSPFVRTPKYNGERRSENDPILQTLRRRWPAGLVEVALGLTMSACFAFSILRSETLIGSPFLLLFASGFLAVGASGLVQYCQALRAPKAEAVRDRLRLPIRVASSKE